MINKVIFLRHFKSLRLVFSGFIALLFLLSVLVVPAFAAMPITQKDIDSINKREFYRDPDEPVDLASCGAASVGTVGKVYMIGDSITEGAESDLTTSFRATGATAIVDGLSSRTLSKGEDPKDGLSVLESSADDYRDADVVVIALGTNGGLTESGIVEAIEIIKDVNDSAVIFWVNIGVDNTLRTGDDLPASSWNTLLNESADESTYYVIDWAKTVSAQSDDFSIIADDGLGVHPNSDGKKLFTQLIVNDVFSSGTSSSCRLELTGSDNPEKVWNYMIAKGLTPFQAAGFMGNMQAEAGFEPRLVEYGLLNSRGEISVAGEPSSLDDEIPPNQFPNGRPGYGIVQWTAPGRKDGLRLFSTEKALPPGDLGLQLDYVWQEISSGGTFRGTESVRRAYIDKYGGNVPVLEALKQTKTVEEATDLILNHYEIPAGIDAAYIKRIGFANSWLVRFGSGGSQ